MEHPHGALLTGSPYCAQAVAGPPGAKGEKVRSWGVQWEDPHPWVLPKVLGRAGVWYLMMAQLGTHVCLSICVPVCA